MALTTNEKKILGYMTDEGKLVGQKRLDVSASDEVAREAIAEYKEYMIPIASEIIANLQASLALNQDKLNALEE